jgi:hypothetical protein
VHPGLDLTDVLPRLLVRLQIGLPMEMTDLGHAIGGTLTRAQYLALNDVRLHTVADIQRAAADVLASILGSTDTVAALTDALRDAAATNGAALPATLLPGAWSSAALRKRLRMVTIPDSRRCRAGRAAAVAPSANQLSAISISHQP